jgi:hypothetical protein
VSYVKARSFIGLTQSRRFIVKVLGTLLLVIVGVVGAAAPATARGAVSCQAINAKGVGQDLGGGRTTARIIGGGLLHGTTEASFVVTGVSGSVASFQGTIVFTVNRGTLTANVSGTLDLASGAFAASTSSIEGTDKLAGASGNLFFNGVEDFSDGSFTEDVSGEICVNLAP